MATDKMQMWQVWLFKMADIGF